MNRLFVCFALFVLALAQPVPASASPAALLAAEDTDKPPGGSGWWETISAKKWEISFVPGDYRYGFRIPLYPTLACIILIISCSSMLDTAQRQKKSATGAGLAMGVGLLFFLGLLWQSAF